MRFKKIFVILASLALFLYASFLCFLYFAQASILYPGRAILVDPNPVVMAGSEVLGISTASGIVEARFLPATSGEAGRQQPVVIFAHGNGEIIDYWLTALDGFRERGIGVLLVEYPGYGRSKGSPSEASIRSAMSAAYDRIVSDPRVDRRRILGFGQSLGGGAICLLADERPLRALMLQSTFPSLDMFAARYWAPSFLLRDHFDSIATVARFAGPIMVIHGIDDQLIPWEQGRRLALAAAHSEFKLYACGHGCWDPKRLPFWSDAQSFLERAGVLSPAISAGREDRLK